MAFKTNDHVTQLRKFIPFTPGLSASYTELQHEPQELNLQTKAISYVKEIIHSKPDLIVLTGNAGHGKTFICEQILTAVCDGSEDIKKTLRSSTLATDGVPILEGSHILRIHTDISQVPIPEAVEYISELVERPTDNHTAIICINEGRLRAVLSAMPSAESAQSLRDKLNDCIQRGIASSDQNTHIINLNFQSLIAESHENPEEGTMLGDILAEWAQDPRPWSVCSDCDAAAQGCPIYRNHQLLGGGNASESDSSSNRRTQGIEDLFRMVEIAGTSTTFRETLMCLAYVITGDLGCSDVEAKLQTSSEWCARHSFYELLFNNHLEPEQLRKLPILKQFLEFDPGRRASRQIDDFFAVAGLEENIDDSDLLICTENDQTASAAEVASGLHVISSETNTNQNQSKSQIEAFERLRRRSFFDLWHSEEDRLNDIKERAKRIGFQYLSDLIWIQTRESNEDPQRLNAIKRELIKGLHAIQGIPPTHDNPSKLSFSQPAFARLQRSTALISGQLAISTIRLQASPQDWTDASTTDSLASVRDTVDWHFRDIILSLGKQELRLDLTRFDYLRRAGSGFLSRRFYATDIRRILNFLGVVAEALEQHDSSIQVLHRGRQFEFSISEGLIQ